MADSIVRTPLDTTADYDFTAFTFNGYHSYEDFGLYRTSDGDRYNSELGPQTTDRTAEVTGGDGMYYFGSNHKQKGLNINIPFDDDTLGRVYRGEGSVQFTCYWPYAHTPDYVASGIFETKGLGHIVPFEQTIKGQYFYIESVDSENDVVNIAFKSPSGTNHTKGSVQLGTKFGFDSEIEIVNIEISKAKKIKFYKTTSANNKEDRQLVYVKLNGKDLDSYTGFYNKSLWANASGLTATTGTCTGENPGDLPAHFVLTKSGSVAANTKFEVGSVNITIPTACYNLEWDSKTGMVVAASTSGGDKIPIDFSGNSCGAIPVGGLTSSRLKLNGGTLKYHYWYY